MLGYVSMRDKKVSGSPDKDFLVPASHGRNMRKYHTGIYNMLMSDLHVLSKIVLKQCSRTMRQGNGQTISKTVNMHQANQNRQITKAQNSHRYNGRVRRHCMYAIFKGNSVIANRLMSSVVIA